MEQVLTGIVLFVVGVVTLLEQFGLIEVVSLWGYVSPVLVVLVGVFMVLRAQGRMVRKHAEKKSQREKNKLAQQMEQEKKQETEKLEKEIAKKEQVVQEQGEVIDDLVNPKV